MTVNAQRMTPADSADLATWPAIRGTLLALRDLVRLRARSAGRADERRALQKVAERAAAAGFPAPASDEAAVDHAKWLADRLLTRLGTMAPDAVPRGRDRYVDASSRVFIGWAALVGHGLGPAAVYDLHPELFGETAAATQVARRGRVQHALWLGGNRPDPDAVEGIRELMAEMTAAATVGAPGESVAADVLAYEWRRLGATDPAARQLLGLLSMISPGTPLDRAVLREGIEPIPLPLKERLHRSRDAARVERAVADRGLVTVDDAGLCVSPAVRDRLWEIVDVEDLKLWASLAVRVMKCALPADTHSATSWPIWGTSYSHLVAVIDAAEHFQVQLGDLPYLLDRASVYQRDGEADPELAVTLAERGLRLSDELGRPNALWHSYLMGNLALALEEAGERPRAIEMMQEVAAFDADMLGEEHQEYANDLLLLANMQKHVGRLREAEENYVRSQSIMERVYDDDPDDWNRTKLVEVLNDHAAFLIGRRSGRTALRRAESNLDEANRLVHPNDYGYIPIVTNRADLRRQQDRLPDAEQLLRTLLSEVDDGTRVATEHQRLGILADLAEVCGELGRSAEQARLNQRAHDLDDELLARHGPSRAGASS